MHGMASKASLSILIFMKQPAIIPRSGLSYFLGDKGRKLLSTSSTPFPLQYEFVIHHPVRPNPRSRRVKANPEADAPDSEPDIGDLSGKKASVEGMDKAKRKYYSKRRKRMYGTDSEDENRSNEGELVELRPEIVKFRTLHKRQEEMFFYDTFAYPWEKDKHYKMVYQLEKKYFPDECLDKAFLDSSQVNGNENERKAKQETSNETMVNVGKDELQDDQRFIFFDEEQKEAETQSPKTGRGRKDIVERKVEDLFKCLKKVHNENGYGSDSKTAEPFLVRRNGDLPSTWDSPGGTVLLVNKPKGWTSFTVCGKLRRLVKVKKVGHAGTLDPMATGLLIVCIGKATKVVDRYQGMIKRYSGIFRLGEATSTWDADSPVIQREAWEHIRDDDIRRVASTFVGQIWQVPPMFSAIKVGGEKMYEKARRGENVELAPRCISIFQFDVERSLEDRQNLIFRVTCSKGTYIRSLCADLGRALGSCAHLTALRRVAIGDYLADDAWEFEDLERAIAKNYL